MSRKTLQNILLVNLLAISLSVQAGWLDTVKDATEIIKQTGVLNQPNNNQDSTKPSQTQKGSDGTITPHTNNDLDFPSGFIIYPRAILKGESLNPFDRVNMPLSAPIRTSSGDIRPRYQVPVEGKVRMFQFAHKDDDSPLLIQKHYESWLADQGYDRLLICEYPCKTYGNSYWRDTIDPRKKLDYNYVPKKDVTYLAALKADSMVVVGIGKVTFKYASVVKVVDGTIIDRSSWDKLKKPVTLPPATTASQPVGTAPQTTGVKAISADDALAYVKAAKGVTFVQVSSYDRGCSFCVRANPEYDKFSIRHAGKAAFLQLAVQPWKDAFKNDFAKTYNITAVPTTLAFKNGKLIRRHDGHATVDQLDKSLVK